MLGYFKQKGSVMILGGLKVSKIVSRYLTPIYIYDYDLICDSYRVARNMCPQFDIFYSLKANPNITICKVLKDLGAGAEVSSAGELEIAEHVGFSSNKIILSGPAKTEDELRTAIEHNIYSISVESFEELRYIDSIARKIRKRAKVTLRINLRSENIKVKEVMVGSNSKFGISEDLIIENLRKISLDFVDIIGIHVYIASQILDEETIADNLKKTLFYASRLLKRKLLSCEVIDFGGGFGVPNCNYTRQLNNSILKNKVRKVMHIYRQKFRKTRLILELGRFLIANAGVFVTKVVHIRNNILITDGGMNHFLRPVFMNETHPTLVINRLGENEINTVDVAGPICSPLDVIAKNIEIPIISTGDILGIFNAGAYGYSMSMLDFLSHKTPAEVLVRKKKCYLIRRRGTFNDFLAKQIMKNSKR